MARGLNKIAGLPRFVPLFGATPLRPELEDRYGGSIPCPTCKRHKAKRVRTAIPNGSKLYCARCHAVAPNLEAVCARHAVVGPTEDEPPPTPKFKAKAKAKSSRRVAKPALTGELRECADRIERILQGRTNV